MGDCRETIGGLSSAPGGNVVSPPQWDDLIKGGIGTRLDSAAGKLAYNLPLKGIDIGDNTLISLDADKIHYNYQVYHRHKLDGPAHFHVHWYQQQAGIPNWWMRWRLGQGGSDFGAWTSSKWTGHAYTYTAGNMLQITGFDPIDLALVAVGGVLAPSDFIQVELTRDSDNSSTLFAGADPVSGDVTYLDFDPHLQIDKAGSEQEYVK